MSVSPDAVHQAPIGRIELRAVQRLENGKRVVDSEIWVTEGSETWRWRLSPLGLPVLLESAAAENARLARERTPTG